MYRTPIIFNLKTFIIFLIVQIIAITVISQKEKSFETKYNDIAEMTAVATVRKSSVQKEFGTETIIEIKECKKNKQLKQTRLKLVDKRKNIFEIGDIIEITGEYVTFDSS